MELLDLLMKKLKSKKVDDIILTYGTNNSKQIKFSNNKIVKTGIEELKDVGIFVVKDKKVVTTNFKDSIDNVDSEISPKNINEKNMNVIVTKIVKLLRVTEPNLDYNGINDKIFKYKKIVDGYDSKIKNLDCVDYVEKGMNASLKEGAKRTNGIFEAHVVHDTILTSSGIEYSDKSSELYFSIRSFVDKDESGHMNEVGRVLKKFDVEKTGEESGKISKEAKNPMSFKKGKFDIVFSPLAFAPMLNAIAESSSIFSVETGLSFFGSKLNKTVGDDNLNIYDDGRLKNGLGSTKADAEGVPTQKTELIKNGIFKNYLHNVSTARKYRVESTGNAGLISPDPWNCVVEKGDFNFDELLKELKEGLYVTNVWYTRFANHHTGDFSTIPRDGCFYVKNGEIVKSLKGMRISENILNMLKNIKSLGNKSKHLRSWEADLPILSPHLLVKNCNITVPTH